jgi:hypothetical protein
MKKNRFVPVTDLSGSISAGWRWGCIKDTIDLEHFSDRFELTPGIALPLGYGSLGMDDLIARFDSTGFVKKDVSGLLELSYTSQLVSLMASDVVSIPDQHFDQFFVRSDIALPSITTASYCTNQKITLSTFSRMKKLTALF